MVVVVNRIKLLGPKALLEKLFVPPCDRVVDFCRFRAAAERSHPRKSWIASQLVVLFFFLFRFYCRSFFSTDGFVQRVLVWTQQQQRRTGEANQKRLQCLRHINFRVWCATSQHEALAARWIIVRRLYIKSNYCQYLRVCFMHIAAVSVN